MDGGLEADLRASANQEAIELPDYLVRNYWWAYLTPASLFVFDNPVFLTALLWGNLPRLVRAACSEFAAGETVLQAANAYGNLCTELAQTVGDQGRLDVIDISPLQVEHVQRKLEPYPHTRVWAADAANPGGGVYDGVCCFFLLHEIPDENKHAVVKSLLAKVRPGGKVVFIDYHQAVRWHPLRRPMDLVFRWLEPFAFGLIRREIPDFAGTEGEGFTWTKTTFFGGLYQKVVAVETSGAAAG
ncbi:MAG: rhodoquinone biosynthesis methyltransferase RquA [Rhodospirillales bacterium]